MSQTPPKPGVQELRAARRASRTSYWFVGIFSVFVNLLMLTGPIYMLQVYDRVLGSRSVETLVALTLLVAFLFAMMGILDFARARIMGRAGARFQALLERRVFGAVLRQSAQRPERSSATGLNDLQMVRQLMTSPVLTSAFDMPFTPLFLLGIWVFHPYLGILALLGGAVLIGLAVLNQLATRGPHATAGQAGVTADLMAAEIRAEAEAVQAMGMRGAAFDRWQTARKQALKQHIDAADWAGSFTVSTRTFRLFLQSAMLGLGAWLVLQNQLTAGAMIAGSILLGRALAPVEQLVGQWSTVQRAMRGWASLGRLLKDTPPEPARTALPKPAAHLEVRGLAVVPPDAREATLRGVTFTLRPGQAVGVIGASGAGKSSLARAIIGVWPSAAGTIRLDGATLDQFAPDTLGQHIGYLPQRVQMFAGTIAENIARLSANPDAEQVVAAAKRADAHDMILRLPSGYDTRISTGGGRLSGGQMQRIALARAMYGDPVILVLDEPNSNLDNEGSEAVNASIRAFKKAGKTILIMAHRPAAIKECDLLLMLDGGQVRSFGPKEEVLRDVVRNRIQIVQSIGQGGVQ